MGDIIPEGCKALFPVNGRPAIEHQIALLGRSTIVCRSPHVPLLKQYGPCIVDDTYGGPAGALMTGLSKKTDEPVTVLFADTLIDELPSWDSWCGVAPSVGERAWDVVRSDGSVVYEDAPAGSTVCVGAYRFADPWRLSQTVCWLMGKTRPQQMGPVLNHYRLPFVEVAGWRNTG